MQRRSSSRVALRFSRTTQLMRLLTAFLLCAVAVHAQNSVERASFLPRHHQVFARSVFPSLSSSLVTTDINAVPIAGGDVLGPPDFPAVLIHQFLPGTDPGFDGLNAELNGITNFRGLAALAYTQGTATDNTGVTHIAQTDIRVYQGEYVTAEGVHKRGTFVEI